MEKIKPVLVTCSIILHSCVPARGLSQIPKAAIALEVPSSQISLCTKGAFGAMAAYRKGKFYRGSTARCYLRDF